MNSALSESQRAACAGRARGARRTRARGLPRRCCVVGVHCASQTGRPPMTFDLANRVEELEQRERRFKLATTGMEGWENYFQSLVMQERDFLFDVMAQTIAHLQRDVRDETKAMLDTALA